MLLSAGAEPARELPQGTLDTLDWAWWTPDGERVVFRGWEKDRSERSYILQPPDGQPRPIAPEGTWCWVPGQAWAPCFRHEDKDRRSPVWELRSLDGGETRPAPWLGQRDIPYAWSPDGRHAFVAEFVGPGVRVFRVEVATGRREPWLDPSPPDPTGVEGFTIGALTPDGRYYAYSYTRTLSDLFLVEGLR